MINGSSKDINDSDTLRQVSPYFEFFVQAVSKGWPDEDVWFS